MYCHKCGKANPKNSNFCQHCGVKFITVAKTTKNAKEPLAPNIPPYPYIISLKKLIILSITTLGIYELIWFYKHFRSFKIETNWSIKPWSWFLSVFSGITAYALFRRVLEASRELDKTNKLPAAGLAVAFLLLGCLWKLPDPYWWISIFTFLPLVPVQKAINSYWETKYPGRIVRSNFGTKNIVWSILGSILLILSIFGSFYTAYGLDKNGNDKFFTSFMGGSQSETAAITQTELAGEKLLNAVNKKREENNVPPLKNNNWVCEVAKIRLNDIHTKGVQTFENTAALQRAMDKVTADFEQNPSLQKDIEPENFTEIYTYQGTVEEAIAVWMSYPENDFFRSKQYEYGCAVVEKGYGVLVMGYGDMSKVRMEYEESSTSEDENTNATLL